jgi:uncharacterized integral membrane protein
MVLAAAPAVFASQNAGDVEVEFLEWDFAIPLIIVIAASAVIGTLTW